MKTFKLILSLSVLLAMGLYSCNSNSEKIIEETSLSTNAEIAVIQFHLENRCVTCNQIEILTKETLEAYPSIDFSLVNVEKAENEAIASAFEAFGTSLFLYNTQTGVRKNLTEFAFMNARNKERFKAKLRKEIEDFSNS